MPTRTLQYADKLLCDSPEIKTLSVEEFERMVSAARGHAFKWTDSLLSPAGVELPTHREGYTPEIMDGLVVCNMGEFGLGVFTKNPIKKGTVIACYTGVVRDGHRGGDNYLFGLSKEKSVSARECGNLAGFIQHLPASSSVKYYIDDIALANLNAEQKKEDGSIWLVANCDIGANEQLGYPYDVGLSSYWGSRGILPTQFDRFGRDLPFVNAGGAIYSAQISPLLLRLAYYLNDKEMLNKIRAEEPDLSELILKRVIDEKWGKSELLAKIVSEVFCAHADLLKIFRPEERAYLLKFFKENRPLLSPKSLDSTNPYAPQRVANYLRFKPAASLGLFSCPKDVEMAELVIPDDFFNIINPLRFYCSMRCIKDKTLDEIRAELKNYALAGQADYARKHYAAAARYWENALRLERDYLTNLGLNSEVLASKGLVFKELNISLGRHHGVVGFQAGDYGIIDLCWNLGNAYLNAADREAPKYKFEYLREAQCCIQAAIDLVKSYDAATKESVKGVEIPLHERLKKFEPRLEIVREKQASLLAVSAADAVAVAAASGGAGAVAMASGGGGASAGAGHRR